MLLLGYHNVANFKIYFSKTKSISILIRLAELLPTFAMLLFFDISIGFVQHFQRKKLSKNPKNYFFQISSKMIILEILLDKIEILIQFTYFQAYFHQYVSYKISFRFWSRICLKWLFLVILMPKILVTTTATAVAIGVPQCCYSQNPLPKGQN